MTEQKSLFKHTLVASISSFSTIFLFFLLILSGRYLGAEDFGRFSFAMAFVFLFDPILDPGLYHLLIREISRKKEDAELYLSHAITWKILLSPLVFLVLAVGVNIIHDDKQIVYSVYLMAFASFLRSFKDAFRTSLMANEYFGLNTTTMIVERGLLFSFGALSLIAGKGLLWLCWIFVIARVIDLVITVLIVRYKICNVSVGRDIQFMKNMVISAVPIGAFYITLNIYNYVDTVLLSILRTNAEVGWYNASYKIYEGLFLFPGILCTVFMPRLSTLFKESIASFQHIMIRGMKYVFCLSLLVTINGVILSEKVITIFYGNAYSNSIISMNILLIGALFVFTLNFLHMVMIAMDKQRVILSLAIFGLFLNVILNLFLIQKYGYLGAAFATVAVESILFIILNLYLYHVTQRLEIFNLLGKCILSFTFPFFVFHWVIPIRPMFMELALINVSILGLLIVFGYFDEDEWISLTNLLPFRKKAFISK